MAHRCATHADSTATHRCDGCSELLCEECVEEGHSLLFCKLCGEMALPLASGQATTSPERQRQRARSAPYSLWDALGYPLRGSGVWLFGTYVGLVALLGGLSLLPGLGLAFIFVSLALSLMLSGLLLSIVRSTANGNNELPGWPDWDFYVLLRDLLQLISVFVVSAVPVVGLLYLAGCGVVGLALGQWSLMCWLAFGVGLALGAALWVVALGSVALYDAPFSAFRLDLHLAALGVFRGSLIQVVIFLVVLTLASEILQAVVLLGLPLVGSLVASAIGTYTLFTGAHLIGVMFRQHADAADELYIG